jgi:uncharacterized protein YdiU (UPF0061 family)
MGKMMKFEAIEQDGRFTRELPGDPITENFPRQVREAFYSFVQTTSPSNPQLVHKSTALMDELEIDSDVSSDFLDIVSGKKPFPNAQAYAMCYGGHQFGHWAGQLGDGRAINIMEAQVNGRYQTFQLKGAGPTPYSRSGDGYAVLRSSIREYLCSEAMHHLGVPTSRALSLVTTGDAITRDILYNGNPEDEPGAIVCRVAPNFIRFGNFEIFAARKDLKSLQLLADYTIRNHYTHLGEPSKETYVSFFREVAEKTLEMILHWQRVGFVHGVMNTDNMSILGLTIDYGPYGWIEDFDLNWTPNTTDAQNRRYRFGNQPNISLWNLTQLANALYGLIEDATPLQAVLDDYRKKYFSGFHEMMLEKLGLVNMEVPETFVQELMERMRNGQMDMTLFFRWLSNPQPELNELFEKASYLPTHQVEMEKESWMEWWNQYKVLKSQQLINADERSRLMKQVNPKYVLRNYMAQLAIDAAEKGNFELIDELYQLLLKPYDEQPQMEKWFAKRPDWALNKVGCSMLSCSS